MFVNRYFRNFSYNVQSFNPNREAAFADIVEVLPKINEGKTNFTYFNIKP